MYLEYSRYNVESPLEMSFHQHICEVKSKLKTVIAGRLLYDDFEAVALDAVQNEVFHILLQIEQRKLLFWSVKDGRVIPEDGKLELETDIDVEEQFVIRRIIFN